MLALTERPRKFSEVVGVDLNITAFKNMCKTKVGDFPQVIMLSGDSGTGKSTCGNIIGSFINCSNPVKSNDNTYYEPCGECPSCIDIKNESYTRDFIYKDASAMGKDDVIELGTIASQGALYESKKIIMIEEAQQLSTSGARGALLKLLEKQRKDVVFILLTMDISKFDKAIISRCQVFNFKKIKSDIISDYLFTLLEKLDPDEKIPESFMKVITMISSNCAGSMRTAIKWFDQCLQGEVYEEDKATDFLNILSEDFAYNTLMGLLSGDTKSVESLKKTNLLEFYNYTFALLLNVKEASLTGDFGSKNIEQRAMKILETKNLDKALDMYISIRQLFGSYNNESIIRKYFYDFIVNSKPIKKQEELPRRRVAL